LNFTDSSFEIFWVDELVRVWDDFSFLVAVVVVDSHLQQLINYKMGTYNPVFNFASRPILKIKLTYKGDKIKKVSNNYGRSGSNRHTLRLVWT
jgi:hypothetical protein